MLAILSIFAAIGIVYGVSTSTADAGLTASVHCPSCNPEVAEIKLSNMQYVDGKEFHELQACANSKHAPWFGKGW